MVKRIGIGLIALLVLIGAAAYFFSESLLRRNAPGQEVVVTADILTYDVKRGNLLVNVIEQGIVESSDNHEIKCKVRGKNTVIWVVENGTQVKKGEVLVRLDTLQIEEAINERKKYANLSQSSAERSRAQVARAKLAVSEYEDGRYVMALLELKKQLTLVQSRLRQQENQTNHTRKKADRGYTTDRLVNQQVFAHKQAKTDLELMRDEIGVLENYTKRIEMKSLEGDLKAALATHEANVERAQLDAERRDKALEEFELCTICAEKDGFVIYPSAAEWKETPDVAEGATVHKDQVLMLMPDLSQMQVKVGIHESIVDRVKPGFEALIRIPDGELDGKVVSVASVARPAGWWTGNLVKYDTIVSLPNREGLRPGMSAEVEVVLAKHNDVILVPVAAALVTPSGAFCWTTENGLIRRRELELGDSNEIFLQVKQGLDEGETVVLNPLASIREAQDLALKSIESADERAVKAPPEEQN